MLQAAAGRPLHLRTSLPPLDDALFGGIPAGSVTEVCGRGWPDRATGCRACVCCLGIFRRSIRRLLAVSPCSGKHIPCLR